MDPHKLKINEQPYEPLEGVFISNNNNNNNNNNIITEANDQEPIFVESIEEFNHRTKRCLRCRLLYTEDSQDGCKYHPGKFESTSLMSGVNVGWTCCRFENPGDNFVMTKLRSPNPEALQKSCPGCKSEESHLEDPQFSLAISKFPFDIKNIIEAAERENAASFSDHDESGSDSPLEPRSGSSHGSTSPSSGSHRSSSSEEERRREKLDESYHRKFVENEEEKEEENSELYIMHKVTDTDTLIGLSLKYNVPISAIQRANRIMTNSHVIFHLKLIAIPRSADTPGPIDSPSLDNETKIIRKFAHEVGCGMDDAKYYLESNEYDYASALSEFNEDKKWEASQIQMAGTESISISAMHKEERKNQKKQRERNCCVNAK